MTRLPVSRDEIGIIVIGHPDPVSPALPRWAEIDGSLTLVGDALDPDHLIRMEVDDHDEGSGVVSAVERLLRVPRDHIATSLQRGESTSVEVDDVIIASLGRLAALVAGHHAERTLGPPSPWWSIEADTVVRGLGDIGATAEVILRESPLLAGIPDDLARAREPGWVAISSSSSNAARAALAGAIGGLGGTSRDVGLPRLNVDPAVHPPLRLAVDPGAIPPSVVDGEEVRVGVAGTDVVPDALDLRRGLVVRLDPEAGELTVTAPVVEGAYYQDALAHDVVVRRIDRGVLVGLAGLQPAGSEDVAATMRVSQHSVAQPLRVSLARQGAPTPSGSLDEVVAAASLAEAAAIRARSGLLDEADDLFEQARIRWEAVGDTDRAAAVDVARPAARAARPLLAEVLVEPPT